VIPYGRQDISEDDIKAVVDVLRSDFLTQGPVVPAFEEALANYSGCRFGVAATSATAALHLACRALDIGPGDRVWTSPITFVATANAALYCGAKIDFVDIDPRTYNLSPTCLEKKLRAAEVDGVLPKAIIPVHLAGQSCDMAAIGALAKRYGIRVIEDASHAVGGSYRGVPVGSCTHSDIAVFSFHPVKIVTTGEGGMAMTNDPQLAETMRLDRSHGVTRDSALLRSESHGPWYYEQIRLGLNYRMTDIAAALGWSQLARLDELVMRRHKLAKAYDEGLAHLPLTRPWRQTDTRSSFHLYIIRLDRNRLKSSHRVVFEALRTNGIGVNLHYIPVYKQPWYRDLGFPDNYCAEAESYYAEAISLPLFPGLKQTEQSAVIDLLSRELRA
jgi:UDP-4-amino-4,6-dideoxy-N-acetyl-beta-L-altrosamine transaminase